MQQAELVKHSPSDADSRSVGTLIKRSRGRARTPSGNRFIAFYVIAVVAASIPLAFYTVNHIPDISSIDIPWPLLALAFYLSETAVIHLQFQRDAHSVSMTEVPLIIGFFFFEPVTLITAELAGVTASLIFNRRQKWIKLIFNLGQMLIHTCLGLLVFHALSSGRTEPDAVTATAAIAAMIVGVIVAHTLVFGAIRISGRVETMSNILEALALAATATVMNTMMAVGAAIMINAENGLWWLGLAPPILVYLVYRAYVRQRIDKSRLSAIFEATKKIHRAGEIDKAVSETVSIAADLLFAERAWVFLETPEHAHYLTIGAKNTIECVMRQTSLDPDSPELSEIFRRKEAALITDPPPPALGELGWKRAAIVAPLAAEDEVFGTLVVTDALGDVNEFDEGYVPLAVTVASQLAVSLQNSRLSEHLAEVRALKERLEDLVKSKDQLIASVSHELRTPLTAIVGLATVLDDVTKDTLAPDESEMLGMIVGQSTDLSYIIDDLLTHARSENGTLTLRMEKTDAKTEVEHLLSTLSFDFEVQSVDMPLPVEVDPTRLRQVIRNLLTNADRYGGQHVWIEIKPEGDHVAIAVCDNGSGVPGDDPNSIFEPYKSAHDQRAQPGSVGLGLALSRRIMEMMNGNLRYERSEGATRFVITIPLS